MMNKESKIYVAGSYGMVGSAIVWELKKNGFNNLILKSHGELELYNNKDVLDFFCTERP